MQTRPSSVRIARTKMMRNAYVRSLSNSSSLNDLSALLKELDPALEKENLQTMFSNDLRRLRTIELDPIFSLLAEF